MRKLFVKCDGYYYSISSDDINYYGIYSYDCMTNKWMYRVDAIKEAWPVWQKDILKVLNIARRKEKLKKLLS